MQTERITTVRSIRPCRGRRAAAARDELIESHLYLVPPIARRIRLTLPFAFDIDDLIAAGNIGLIRAANRYRPADHNGTPFSAFARPRIQGAVLDSVRRTTYRDNVRPGLENAPEPTIATIIEQNLDDMRVRRRLREAIASLPEGQRALIIARYLHDAGNLREVGKAIGMRTRETTTEHRAAIDELRRKMSA